MKNRIVIFVLSLALVLTMIPFTAFATVSENVCEYESEYFTSIEEAVAYANENEDFSPFITLLKDTSLNGQFVVESGTGLSLELNGFKLMNNSKSQRLFLVRGTLNLSNYLGEDEGVICCSNNAEQGGAIYVDNLGNVSLNKVTVFGSTAKYGGAIYVAPKKVIDEKSSLREGRLTVNNSFFYDNAASVDGGAVYNLGYANIKNTQIAKNKAQNGKGGAVYNEGTLSFNNCEFTQNVALYADDVYSKAIEITTKDCTFKDGNDTNVLKPVENTRRPVIQHLIKYTINSFLKTMVDESTPARLSVVVEKYVDKIDSSKSIVQITASTIEATRAISLEKINSVKYSIYKTVDQIVTVTKMLIERVGKLTR